MNVEELRPHLPAFLFCGWRKIAVAFALIGALKCHERLEGHCWLAVREAHESLVARLDLKIPPGCFLFHLHTPPKTNRISTFGSDWESADLVYMIIYDSFEEG